MLEERSVVPFGFDGLPLGFAVAEEATVFPLFVRSPKPEELEEPSIEKSLREFYQF